MNEVISNSLLAALPTEVYSKLAAGLEPVAFRRGEVLHEQGEVITRSYFPLTGVISLVLVTEEGHSIEIAMAGKDGVGGIPYLPEGYSPWRSIVQLAGDGLAIDTDTLREHAAQHPELQIVLLRYMGFLHKLSAQNIACNRFHTIAERAARWLLMVRDRSDTPNFELTQEFLAQMLGVHRPNVTAVIGLLKRKGLIERTRRGEVTIVDARGLEAAACECYGQIRQWTQRIATATDSGGATS
jgi:CRP-like cAMP-binding protein